ncbi:unnamed protein product [Peniophora sp. CBMAI 1063]|nr:unnamed protein product [Peniophora sp. CBMAI 1063]
MHASFKALALLAAVASASATSFKLKAHVTANDLSPSIEGQEGVAVANGQLAYEGGVFTVCPGSVLQQDTDENLVSFKSAGQRTLFGCADVQLQEA